MVRPCKRRKIGHAPAVTYFKPQGVPMRQLEEVNLLPEELEVIRLKHVAGLSQTEAALEMGISQSTFQRMLFAAHQKIAEGLVLGKAIKIENS